MIAPSPTPAAAATPPTSLSLDAAALTRHYRCTPCEVSWHGTDPTCWSCGDRGLTTLGAIHHGRDAVRTPGVDPDMGEQSGARLTRFGPKVDAVMAATPVG